MNENRTGFMVSVIRPGEHSIDCSWRLGRVAYGTQTLIKTDTIALLAPVGVEPFPKTSRRWGGVVGRRGFQERIYRSRDDMTKKFEEGSLFFLF